MKQFFIQLSAAVFLLSVFSFRCLGADKYTLELNLEKGKTYKQCMVSDVKMAMNAMGQKMTMNMKMEMNINFDVMERNNDVYDIRMSYQKIKINMDGPAPIAIDSDSPENSSDNILNSLMGIPLDIQLTRQGKVTSVKGTDKLIEKLNTVTNEQSKQMISQQFSEKMIQRLLEQSSSYFPDKPVAIGDSWDIAANIDNNGIDIINKMILTLKQVQDNVAVMEFTGTLSTPEGGAVINVQGMDANVSVNGTQAGTVQTDMKTGWVVRSEATQKFTQTIEVMGQTMPQEMEVKTTVTTD